MPVLEELMQRIGYAFQDKALLKRALTHASVGQENNQRLEFLGDAVLQLCVSDLLYSQYPSHAEGELTSHRASLVREETLARVAEELSLASHIQSIPPLRRNSRGRRSMLADAMEAVLGAIYLDGGLQRARAFVSQHLLTLPVDSLPLSNAKSALQEKLQEQGAPEPEYRQIAQEGPPHDRLFTVAVYEKDRELGRGAGRSKRDAEQQAARAALDQLDRAGDSR